MRRETELQEAAMDPLKFDALLTVFQRPDAFKAEETSANQLAQNLIPNIPPANGDDCVFTALKDTIENYTQPCLVVSEHGQVVALNRSAFSALDLEISDKIDDCGLEPLDAVSLTDQINAVINADGDHAPKSFCRAFYRNARRTVNLAIVPHRAGGHSIKTALVFLIDIGWNGAIGNYISKAYDLTQSEQEILEMFILGDNLEQIAKSRGRSFRTVRTQFYSALNKCGLSSQVDLVREVVAGSLFQSLLPQVVDTTHHPHRKELTMLRPNGRTLDVIMSGDFEGTPLMMLCTVGVQKFTAAQERKLFEASVCLYAISPPSYGRTSPPPKDQDRLSCLTADVISLLDQLGLPNAPFLSFATSLLPTLRLTNAAPDRISRVLSISTIPPAPYHKVANNNNSDSVVGAIAKAMLVSPTMKNLLTRSAIRAWSILGTRKMSKIHAKSEPDVEPYLMTPENIEAIDESFKSSVAQGFSQVIKDCEDIHSDWCSEVEACSAPITIVHGRKNNTTKISIINAFAQDFPNKISLQEIEDAGSFLHITHEDFYVQTLKSFAESSGSKAISASKSA